MPHAFGPSISAALSNAKVKRRYPHRQGPARQKEPRGAKIPQVCPNKECTSNEPSATTSPSLPQAQCETASQSQKAIIPLLFKRVSSRLQPLSPAARPHDAKKMPHRRGSERGCVCGVKSGKMSISTENQFRGSVSYLRAGDISHFISAA